MDEVKDKMKGLMKKVNNLSSSSSAKFKGQGRVLGSAPTSSPSSSSSAASAAAAARANPPPPKPISRPAPPPPPDRASRDPTTGFDPFDPLVSTTRRSANGCSLSLFECPVCSLPFPSEEDVSAHLDGCLGQPHQPELAARVAEFASGASGGGSVDVVVRLFSNVVREPGNEKFRRIRMGNPKIREAIGDARGGVELLECVGFVIGDDGGEVWATMEAPSEERIALIKEAVSLLERSNTKPEDSKVDAAIMVGEAPVEPKKIDRKVRVFFSVPENVAAKIDVPDSFYDLSALEIKREADMRKKKMAESQLLIPKSFREKQAMASRKKYKMTIIRIQFPDGVVLQGVFLPWEPTTVLYEFVSSALKEASLEFDLLRPALPKPRVIPRFPRTGDKTTLDDEDLVPSALIKFKPIETDSIVFTGLCNELLEASEPLTSTVLS